MFDKNKNKINNNKKSDKKYINNKNINNVYEINSYFYEFSNFRNLFELKFLENFIDLF